MGCTVNSHRAWGGQGISFPASIHPRSAKLHTTRGSAPPVPLNSRRPRKYSQDPGRGREARGCGRPAPAPQSIPPRRSLPLAGRPLQPLGLPRVTRDGGARVRASQRPAAGQERGRGTPRSRTGSAGRAGARGAGAARGSRRARASASPAHTRLPEEKEAGGRRAPRRRLQRAGPPRGRGGGAEGLRGGRRPGGGGGGASSSRLSASVPGREPASG